MNEVPTAWGRDDLKDDGRRGRGISALEAASTDATSELLVWRLALPGRAPQRASPCRCICPCRPLVISTRLAVAAIHEAIAAVTWVYLICVESATRQYRRAAHFVEHTGASMPEVQTTRTRSCRSGYRNSYNCWSSMVSNHPGRGHQRRFCMETW